MSRIGTILGLTIACLQAVYPAALPAKTYLRTTVTASDEEGDRLLFGLTRDQFQVFEGSNSQFIDYFSASPSPSSVVILLDMDGSMKAIDLNASLKTMVDICNSRAVPDEVALIAFSDKASLIKSFGWRVKDIEVGAVLKVLEDPQGYEKTGMVKALKLAGERLETEASNYNQAFVLITDGEEDLNHATYLEFQKMFKDLGVRVYGIFFPGMNRLDYGRLHELVVRTGGRYFQINDLSPLEVLMRWIFHELRYQYIIGFTPSQSDGGDSQISVQLSSHRFTPGTSIRFTMAKAIGRIRGQGSGN